MLNFIFLACLVIVFVPNKIYGADGLNISSDIERSRMYKIIHYREEGHDLLYTRLKAREQTSEYFVGVKTTGIACRFGCPVSPPLQQNCIFSAKLHNLISYGMRECKRCNPLSHGAPEEIRELLSTIENTWFPEKKFSSHHTKAIEWVQEKHGADLLK